MKTDLIKINKNPFFGQPDSLRRLLIYFVSFLIIGFILFWIAQSIAYIGFGTMDDLQIQNLLNGSMGVSDGFCNHLNAILGAFFAFLYSTLPAVNWYGVFLLAMLLLSCALIAAVLAQRLSGKAGFALGFAIFPLICLTTLYSFTYTVIAYVMLSCALVCIAYAFYLKDKPRRMFLWIFSAVLGVLAVMLRTDTIASAAAAGGVYALFLLIRYKKAAVKTVLITAAVLFLSFGFILISNLLFAVDPVWSQYYRFNETRIDMQDRFYPPYSQNQLNYEKYGWSENDYNMFYTANITDDPKFATENLEKIDATYRDIARLNLSPREIAASLWDLIIHSVPLITLLAAAFVLALISSRARLLSIAVFLFPFLMQAALVAIQRPFARVVVPHYYIALVLLLCLIDAAVLRQRFASKETRRRPLAVVALILALSVSVYPLYDTYHYSFQLAEQRRDPQVSQDYNYQLRIYDYFAQHKDSFYVYSMELGFYSYSQYKGILDTKPKEYYANSFSMGGWAVRSKEYESFKKAAGVSSLPRDLIDNNRVYFVSFTRLDSFTKYFYETYGIPVKYELADNSGIPAYRVKTAASPAEMGAIITHSN